MLLRCLVYLFWSDSYAGGILSDLTPAGNVCFFVQVAEVIISRSPKSLPSLKIILTVDFSPQISTTTLSNKIFHF